MPSRRHLLVAAASAVLPSLAVAGPSWPSRPVTVVVPLQAGSAADAAVRIVLEVMEVELGQAFRVANVLGKAGRVGAAQAAAATPDGHTLAALNSVITTVLPLADGAAVRPGIDLVPIGGIARLPSYLGVSAKVPARTVPEFVAWARARDGAATYASAGTGSAQHLAAELLMALADIRLTPVVYRGATEAAAGLAAGAVDAMVIAHTLLLPYLGGDRVRVLGHTGARRTRLMPDIPTLAEQGIPGYDYAPWLGLFAPGGTPEPMLARLRATLARVLSRPGVAARLAQAGTEIWPVDAAGLAEAMRSETARWQAVIRRIDLTDD